MIDTNKLREAVYNFAFYSKPSNANASASCTVGDINRVISNLSQVLNAFIDELEES